MKRARGRRHIAQRSVSLLAIFVVAMMLSAIVQAAEYMPPRSVTALPRENPSSVPTDLNAFGNYLYFAADDGIHGREIWRIDDRGNCEMIADLAPGPDSSDPKFSLFVDNWLYLTAWTPLYGRELWMHNIQTGEMVMVHDVNRGGASARFEGIRETASTVFFFAQISQHERYSLWRTQAGKVGATEVVPRFAPDTGPAICATFVDPDGGMFFNAGTLWHTDGTRKRTRPVLSEIDITLWSDLARFRGEMMFAAKQKGDDVELWVSDGTIEGTRLVKDIAPGRSGSFPHYFWERGDINVFVADDGLHGKELWRTDGTPEETRMVIDLNAGIASSSPWALHGWKGLLIFCATSSAYGEEIFLTGGTAAGTRILKDIVPGKGSSGPNNIRRLNNTLFFTCDEGIHGEELWMSDGTAEGTRLAADISRPKSNPGSWPGQLTPVGDSLFFSATGRDTGEELWISDGTEEGTQLVCDANPGIPSGTPRELCSIADRLFFTATDREHGRELWCIDAAGQNPRIVRDIRPGPESAAPAMLCATPDGAGVCFTADDGRHGRELWRSDATEEGTVLVADLSEEGSSTEITDIFVLFGELYFYVAEKDGAATLYRAGPDFSAGKVLTIDAGTSESLLDQIVDQDTTVPLSTGTVPDPRLVAAIHPFASGRKKVPELTLGKWLYFTGRTMRYGAELWRSDGSIENTSMVQDVFPGRSSSSPGSFCAVDGTLYFLAEHHELKRVVWRYDGPPGTVRPVTVTDRGFHIEAKDLAATGINIWVCGYHVPFKNVERRQFHILKHKPAANDWHAGRYPMDTLLTTRQITVAGGIVFFTNDDGIHGDELWRVSLVGEGDEFVQYACIVKDILGPGDYTARVPAVK
jgi:ELWxxDGT repeat protein